MKSGLMKKISNNWFIALFFIFCCYAGYGILFEGTGQLSGVVDNGEAMSYSVESVMDGTYQAYLNTYFENNFWGRKQLIRARNQLLYSVCGISPNENVVIGKDKYLFEPWYITSELQIDPPATKWYFTELGEKLKKLGILLEENGKELYVFITPSKAHFFPDKAPLRYELLSNMDMYETDNYTEFVDILIENNIPFFDAIEYVEENAQRYTAPLFYKSGIHWCHVWGESAAAEFLDYINSRSRWDLGEIKVEEIRSDAAISPNTDLYDSLNLFTQARDEWYDTRIELVREGADKPNVFLRGGSFMGQSLNMLIEQGIFGKDIHFENNYYFRDRYTKRESLSSFSAYEEIDLNLFVRESDIMILEVNENAIPYMSWEFIDYLLEHPEYVGDNYQPEVEDGKPVIVYVWPERIDKTVSFNEDGSLDIAVTVKTITDSLQVVINGISCETVIGSDFIAAHVPKEVLEEALEISVVDTDTGESSKVVVIELVR